MDEDAPAGGKSTRYGILDSRRREFFRKADITASPEHRARCACARLEEGCSEFRAPTVSLDSWGPGCLPKLDRACSIRLASRDSAFSCVLNGRAARKLNVFDAVDAAFGGPGEVRHVAIEIPATGNGQCERYCNDSHDFSPKLIAASLRRRGLRVCSHYR
jgi:hypothetical protein